MAPQKSVSKVARFFAPGMLAIAAALLSGCDPGKEKENERAEPPVPATKAEAAVPDPAPSPAPTTPTTPAGPTTPVKAAAGEEVDLIGDKPGAAANVKPGEKITVLLDPIEPDGPLNRTARQCYRLMADLKTNIEKVDSDLDGGGKQVTRLIHSSDEVCKNITDLAGLWPNDKLFRDQCIGAKRQALTLNDELSRVPRTWAHVRWAFTATLKAVSGLRLRARELADAEPKPTAIVGKDGKITLVEAEPTIDPAIAKREEASRKAASMRAQLKRYDDEKKDKKMPLDLEGAK